MRAIAFGLLLTAAWCGAASAQTVGGDYIVNGTNPDGSSYAGTVEISPSGDGCRMVWHIGSTWRGICMLANQSFAASYRHLRSGDLRAAAGRCPQRGVDHRRPEGRRHRDLDPEVTLAVGLRAGCLSPKSRSRAI
jgi:hypothetical protein